MPDTIFALSSGRPPAAIAVIRISGMQAHHAAERICGTLPPARTATVRELREEASGDLLDQALVLRFDGPASATGEDSVEFHCHGGRAVTDAVLAALAAIHGLRLAQPGEFTRRAFEKGRVDLTEVEGLADLLEAETESQRKAALLLADGGLRLEIEQWQERLLGLSAQAERAIDYDEDDARLDPKLVHGCRELAEELQSWVERPRAEPLKDGIRVVVAGPPNAGKSSLINAVAGTDKAIVTEVPGTTRDLIEVPLAIGGIAMVLTDTAGLRETEDQVEAIGIALAERSLQLADILLWLGEPETAPEHPRLIYVHAKADLAARGEGPQESVPVSTVTGTGLKPLLEDIVAKSKVLLPAEGTLALNRRQALHLAEARESLDAAASAADLVIIAEQLRLARASFDRLTGRAGVEPLLDALFSRFCLGK